MAEQKTSFDVSNRALFKVFLSILLFVGLIYFVYKTQHVLTLLVISGFLAVSIYRPVSFIARKLRVSRAAGTFIAYVIVVSFISYLVYATLPSMIRQMYNFTTHAPEMVEQVKNSNGFGSSLVTKFNLEQKAAELSTYVTNHWQDIASNAVYQVQTFVGFLSSIITVLLLTLLIIAEGPEMLNTVWALYPNQQKMEKHKHLVHKMYQVVTGYMNGQVILTTLNATFALIFTLIAAKVFGVSLQYPLALWALIWMAGLIPMVGATLGAIIAVFFTIFYSWKLSLAIVIYYVIYQQIENNTLQPWIQSKSINATALMIIVSALIGGSLAGVFGAFLAIPVAGCLRIWVNYMIEENRAKNSNSSTKTEPKTTKLKAKKVTK